MSGALYCCALKERLQAVQKYNAGTADPAKQLNAIDYLEIYSVDQKTLRVVLLLPAPGITPQHCRIDGGVRITGIQVTSIDPPVGNELRLHVNAAGDFSDYVLRLVDPSAPDKPAPGFDPRLAQITFNFKALCPADFDCAPAADCPPPAATDPVINYLAKDYETFRTLMLDRIAVLQPGFTQLNAADIEVAIVEVLAYAADHLSYYQDAVGTEAYLGTARSRISLRRHARLLDYYIHDGCNARVWMSLEYSPADPTKTLYIPKGTPLLTRGQAASNVVPSDRLSRALDANTQVFETCASITLTQPRTLIRFYTWSDANCWLAAGGTSATLVSPPALSLSVGDILLFEEVLSPTSGLAVDADPSHRCAVRITGVAISIDPVTATQVADIQWDSADALPFALCLSAQIGDPPQLIPNITVIRGNIVLADHGLTHEGVQLSPPAASNDMPYRPVLPDAGLANGQDYDPTATVPASQVPIQDPRQSLPLNMSLQGQQIWYPQRDLLGSDAFTPDFVPEIDNDGLANLRFGANGFGLPPTPGEVLQATYRIGGGTRGNVGADSITRIVFDSPTDGLQRIRNPMAAVGGQDPESAEQIRQYAPQAFRVQERAVTETDYANTAEQYGDVLRAVAQFRWTGSWYTVYITVDRTGGASAVNDPVFKAGLVDYINQYRLAGYDIEVRDPTPAPLDIGLQVCVSPDRFAADVKVALLKRLGTGTWNATAAFFNPDRFSFGDPLYLSQLVEAALEVPGVASVKVLTFQRWGKTPNGELQAELIQPQVLEVLRLDNDPSFPENGRLDLDMRGGQ